MTDVHRPKLSILSDSLIKSIYQEALKVLETLGVFVENEEALRLLGEAGMKTDKESKRTFMKEELVARCLESAPRKIELFDVFEKPKVRLEGDLVHYDPGSAALNILDGDEIRKPLTGDFVKFSKVVETLQNIDAQSTALICSDVPEEIQDRYRLYIALHFCSKPIVTGTFREDAFADMKEMLIAIRGDAERLSTHPLAIFDACPSPPLKWSSLTCQSVIDAARCGIPSEFISMPLSGATGPVTLAGTLVQHTAETLSGVVISQLAKKGAPVIYGGSPSIFDMKKGTTPMGAIETMMIDSSYAQMGKFLGLPVHAYMGLSDAKRFDYQSGLETGIGIVLAALAGVNMISGAGMLDFESCQSLDKLVVDNEIIGMAKRLIAGISPKGEPMALDILMDVIQKGENFLSHPSTLKHFRSEFYRPGPAIDRANLGEWERDKKDIRTRTKEVIQAALKKDDAYRLDEEKSRRLREIMERAAKRFGMQRLPELEPERVGAR
jgi:trimethylamine---corrinoid protein Co-methyltransferase